MRTVLLASAIAVAHSLLSFVVAEAGGLQPGQYSVGGLQSVCFNGDGTWYGTTFNFSGTWFADSGKVGAAAAVHGNYQIKRSGYFGYGNDTLTIKKKSSILTADWHDWLDDESYENFAAVPVTLEKKNCDKAYSRTNKHAASQQG